MTTHPGDTSLTPVRVLDRTVEVVATATLEGSSILDLWWKSGSTTGGAARPAPPT